jgi:hypothetical protein
MTCCDIDMPHPFNLKGYKEATTTNVIEGSNFES